MKMKKIKLNSLSARKMSEKQMGVVNGGKNKSCSCSCYYANTPGGSSIVYNRDTNWISFPNGGYSKQGTNKYIIWGDPALQNKHS
ncbi:rSAM-modified peptide [Marinilabiliaceae bacterium JC040]|nr:rSAM-modified peptide [Marinilabiliaceae bacterium JC040]